MPAKPQPAKRKEPKPFDKTGRRFTKIRACLGDIELVEFKPTRKGHNPDPILRVQKHDGTYSVYLTKAARRKLAALLAEPNTKPKGK